MLDNDSEFNAADRPWIKFYARDWMLSESVRLMSFEERGIYHWLICMCWSDETIPADTAKLARLLGLDLVRFEAAWASLASCFVASPELPGRLVQPRIEEERLEMIAVQRRRVESGKKAGAESVKARKISNEASTNTQRLPNESSTTAQRLPNESSTTCQHTDTDTDTDTISTEDSIHTDSSEATAKALPLPGIERIDEAVSDSPLVFGSGGVSLPITGELPAEWPDTLDGMKRLAITFLAPFANCRSKLTLRRHGQPYVDTLHVMKSRRGVTVADAWRAFATCLAAHDGVPIFGPQAKAAISYLVPTGNVLKLCKSTDVLPEVEYGFGADDLPITRPWRSPMLGFRSVPVAKYPRAMVDSWLIDHVDPGGWAECLNPGIQVAA